MCEGKQPLEQNSVQIKPRFLMRNVVFVFPMRRKGRIMGAKVCQVCGEIGLVTCWIQAVGAHHCVNGQHEYVCSCTRREQAAQILRAQSFRFCELCRSRIVGTIDQRYERGVWHCTDCKGRIERDGYLLAIDESRGHDPSAAGAFVREARHEWHFGLTDNALVYYRKAILIYRCLAEVDPRRWRSELDGIQREREAIALWLLNRASRPERSVS
jgi:ribosomal protein L37AE/L43A